MIPAPFALTSFGRNDGWQIVTALWFAAMTIGGALVYEARCPRCRKRFHGPYWYWTWNPVWAWRRYWKDWWPRSCRYCGAGPDP